jgi:hypothetical protein
MHQISTGRILPRTLGHFRIKLTIIPARYVLRFVSEYRQNDQFFVELPCIENKLLYDMEEKNSIYPNRFVNQMDRHHLSDADVLRNMRNHYLTHLNKANVGGNSIYDNIHNYSWPIADYHGNFNY